MSLPNPRFKVTEDANQIVVDIKYAFYFPTKNTSKQVKAERMERFKEHVELWGTRTNSSNATDKAYKFVLVRKGSRVWALWERDWRLPNKAGYDAAFEVISDPKPVIFKVSVREICTSKDVRDDEVLVNFPSDLPDDMREQLENHYGANKVGAWATTSSVTFALNKHLKGSTFDRTAFHEIGHTLSLIDYYKPIKGNDETNSLSRMVYVQGKFKNKKATGPMVGPDKRSKSTVSPTDIYEILNHSEVVIQSLK